MYWAEYGRTRRNGSESEHRTTNTSQNTPVEVRVDITGLARSTRYHYRVCASDSQQRGGPGCGEDRTS